MFAPRLRPGLVLALAVAVSGLRLQGCTVFVLTDPEHTLFCNNEDFSNPATRLWFVPAGPGYLGCAYVGFDDGWAQGGVNTAGLAFDWVAGETVEYTPAESLRRVRGNPSQRMLETCTSVEEAIAFYRAHRETEFARATLLVADRSGASVLIGARAGELYFDRQERSRGFGYGGAVLRAQLAAPPPPTVTKGTEILRACRQQGETPTQYSNLFDLRTGEIWVYPAPQPAEPVRLQLDEELGKGGQAYEIPRLGEQLRSGGTPLRPEQERFHLDRWPADEQPDATQATKIERLLRDAAQGNMSAEDYAPAFWSQLAPAQAELRRELARLGALRRVTLVTSTPPLASGQRCIADFNGARVLQRWEFDAAGRVTRFASEFVELERP